jgi:hypothetical protein
MAAGQRPVNITPVRNENSNSYHLPFALRPGVTRLQIAYRLKYTGSTTVSLRFPASVPRLGVVVPEGLHFTSAKGLRFQRVAERGADVEMMTGVPQGQAVAFRIAGNPVTTSAQAKKIETQPAQMPSHLASDARAAAGTDHGRGLQMKRTDSQRSVYILTALLIAIGITILWLSVVLPRLSVGRRFRATRFGTARARQTVQIAFQSDLVKKANQ